MKTKKKKSGFTIVELLTVMAIIAILMGLLVPALQQVRKLAKDTSQRSQFNTIGVALDIYSNPEENGSYPDSKAVGTLAANQQTVGAQRLAEALVGRDLLGLDANTTWDAYNDEIVPTVYASVALKGSDADQVTKSLSRREKTYIDVDKVEAFQVGQLFTGTVKGGNVYDGLATPAPVLTDTYRAKRVTLSNGKVVMAGTPILYYKAKNSTVFPDTNSVTTITDIVDSNSIYSSLDNEELVELFQMTKPQTGTTNMHHFDKGYTDENGHYGRWLFYDTITNKGITAQPRPYNLGESRTPYILMSAGADGIYGTKDDIYNFQQ